MRSHWMSLVAATALAAGLAACKGDTGPAGAGGATGPTGPGGTSTGTVSGKLTVTGNSALPVPNVTVKATPTGDIATSAANGTYSLTLPIGTYSIEFSGTGIQKVTVPNVSVVAGTTITLDQSFAYTPIHIDIAAADYAGQSNTTEPFTGGFSKTISLTATVTGATGTPTYSWTLVGGPGVGTGGSAAIVSGATTATVQFQAGTFAEATANLVGFIVPPRPGFIGVSREQQTDMSWTLKLTVTDAAGYSQNESVIVSPATVTQPAAMAYTMTVPPNAVSTGPANDVPVGGMVIANDVLAASYNWTLDVGTTGSTATLGDATARNPWFVADKPGKYVLTNSAPTTPTVLTVFADTYAGVSSCQGCHSANYAAWQTSAHANFYWKDSTKAPMSLFQAGVDGYAAGSHYSSLCAKCHTVGGDPAQVGNGGFADQVATTGWTFPTPTAGYWEGITSTSPYYPLKKFDSIQCENCHGPVSTYSSTPMVSYSAGMCARCHDEPPYHTKYKEWQASAHADFDPSSGPSMFNTGNADVRGTTAAHCGRCHASQGFVYWLGEQQAGSCNLVNGAVPSTCQITQPGGVAATVPFLQGLGLTTNMIEPQTCQACHDPHTTRLRVDGSTQALPAGFGVDGAGAGAICMMCHNTRNGPHNDQVVLASVGAPHAPSQTDVLMGQNAYFVTIGQYVSRHTAVADTCAGCHVKLNSHQFAIQPSAVPALCANCHSSNVDGAATQAAVQNALNALATKLSSVLAGAIGTNAYTVVAYDANENPQQPAGSCTILNDPASNPGVVPTAVVPTTIHGQPSLTITLSSAITDPFNPAATTSTILTRVADIKTGNVCGGTVIAGPASNFVKAEWNYLLFSTDGSLGIHNPSFAFAALAGAKNGAAIP